MRLGGTIGPSGGVAVRVRRPWPSFTAGRLRSTLRQIVVHGLPWFGQEREVWTWRLRNLPHLWRGAWRVLVAQAFGIPTHYGCLWLTLVNADGRRIPLGLASMRVVTTAGVNALVDAFQGTVEPENFKFHGFGTGSTAEAVGDTALVTELTTQYTGDVRPTGSQAENGANVYRTVGTLDPDSGGSIVLREHGIFSAAAAGALLDRSVFGAVTVDEAAGDTVEATYDFTVTAGS